MEAKRPGYGNPSMRVRFSSPIPSSGHYVSPTPSHSPSTPDEDNILPPSHLPSPVSFVLGAPSPIGAQTSGDLHQGTFSPTENVLPSLDAQKMVCATCWGTVFSTQSFHTAWLAKSAPRRLKSAGLLYITPTWAEVQHSIDSMQCSWCGFVSRMIMDSYLWETPPPADRTFQLRFRFSQRDTVDDSSGDTGPYAPSVNADSATYIFLAVDNKPDFKFCVHTTEGDPSARYIPQREVLVDVNSATAYNLVNNCISRCIRHKFCPAPHPTPLPTRVIDCIDPDWPRLLVNLEVKEEKYVALSYVWGCKEQPHCTTQTNLQSYVENIPLEYIPKTILDALTVTRALGLRYLWVDAFCIIQDSEEDKAREIRQIRRIFHGAYTTIIAASADTVYDGFLHERNPPEPPATTLPFYCLDGVLGTMDVRMGQHAPANPIDERAWCLEEHVLSPRRLIYSSHTLQYECQTMHVNVNGAPNFVSPKNGIPYLPYSIFLSQLEISPGSNTTKDSHTIWDSILTAYTRRTVTKARDRLNALAGVAEQFQRVWPDSKYVAGLWDHHFPGCLLWNNTGGSQCYVRPEKSLAPSWSWASINGEVTTDFLEDINEGILCDRDSILVDIIAANSINPYGSVKFGSLIIDTILQPALWHPGSAMLFDVDTSSLPDWVPSEQDKIGDVMPDTLEPESEDVREVKLAVMRDTGYSLHGLVLITATDPDPSTEYQDLTFRRVGFFKVRTSDRPELAQWIQSSSQHIKLV
ncbi:heterokaryon incompatibility protein-domain-containing protein [Collybia nuda]|uniref:Heterokaryon incompatibility protein-domain-containing protein n=1 Tax=Collybia nuda TaxID=64659 RepID=A0A9P5Y282_9AGAR|nr:heterokaryon incompatibility protein-domain-containing protein [Collybia nuda]